MSVIGVSFIQIMFQVATIVVLLLEPWYAANKCDQKMSAYELPCLENSSVFLVSIFQYVFVSVAFMVGKPFRQPLYTNFWFTFCVIFLTILNLVMLFNPFNWQMFYPSTDPNATHQPITMILSRKIKEFSFQYTLFVVILLNTIVTMLWERVVVVYASKMWKDYKKTKKLSYDV